LWFAFCILVEIMGLLRIGAGVVVAGTAVAAAPVIVGSERARRSLSAALSQRLEEPVDVVELDLHWVRGTQHVRGVPTLQTSRTNLADALGLLSRAAFQTQPCRDERLRTKGRVDRFACAQTTRAWRCT
jgi:hypothetical protein